MIHKRTRGEHKVLILVPRSKRVRECTHMIVRILYEGIATGLAAQRPSLMKEVVEAHEFAKLGEDLDESISRERRNSLFPVQHRERRYVLIHCWVKIADVQTVLEEFTLRWRLRKGGRGRWIWLRGGVGEM